MRSSRISDATALRMLKANDAKAFQTDKGPLWAIYDEEFVMSFIAPEIEGTAPALTCRSCDVESLELRKDSMITADGFARKVHRILPSGDGQTILLLAR